jgi:hypothetical protein
MSQAAQSRIAAALQRTGERVTLGKPGGAQAQVWAKIAPMAADPLTDTAQGQRYRVLVSPLHLAGTGITQPDLASITLTRANASVLRGLGRADVLLGGLVVRHELTMTGA